MEADINQIVSQHKGAPEIKDLNVDISKIPSLNYELCFLYNAVKPSCILWWFQFENEFRAYPFRGSQEAVEPQDVGVVGLHGYQMKGMTFSFHQKKRVSKSVQKWAQK